MRCLHGPLSVNYGQQLQLCQNEKFEKFLIAVRRDKNCLLANVTFITESI